MSSSTDLTALNNLLKATSKSAVEKSLNLVYVTRSQPREVIIINLLFAVNNIDVTCIIHFLQTYIFIVYVSLHDDVLVAATILLAVC